MADGSNIGIVVSVGTLIGCVITFIKFWTGLTDKITEARNKAESALQEAAEAKNDLDNFREALDEMARDLNDRIERLRREDGDSLAAIRQHVTDLAMYVRDNFVRNKDFDLAMHKIDTKLDRLYEGLRGG